MAKIVSMTENIPPRVVNVIEKPHLVSYKADVMSDYRCCAICKYKVIMETGDGRLCVASVLDDFSLGEFDIDEAVRKVSDETQSEDWFYPFDMDVCLSDFENFVKGDIEEGVPVIGAFARVVAAVRMGSISGGLRQELESLDAEIKELLKK